MLLPTAQGKTSSRQQNASKTHGSRPGGSGGHAANPQCEAGHPDWLQPYTTSHSQRPHLSAQNLSPVAPSLGHSSQYCHPYLERGETISGCSYVGTSTGTGPRTLLHENSNNSKR